MSNRLFACALLVTAVGCRSKTTTVSITGSGPPPADVTAELSAFFQEHAHVEFSSSSDGSTLKMKSPGELDAIGRKVLGVVGRLTHDELHKTPLTVTLEAGGERTVVTLDGNSAKRTIRSTTESPTQPISSMVCSWDVSVAASVPDLFVSSAIDLIDSRARFQASSESSELKPLLQRVHVLSPDRASFVFEVGKTSNSVSVGLNNVAEFDKCFDTIATEADSFFVCNLMLPKTCAWMRTVKWN